MTGLRVMLYGEGEERSTSGSPELEDGFVGVGVEASAPSWQHGGVFDPDSEAPVEGDGG